MKKKHNQRAIISQHVRWWPREYLSLHPVRYSEPEQTRHWATCSGFEVSPALNRDMDQRPSEMPFTTSYSVGSYWGQVLWLMVWWGATLLSTRMNHSTSHLWAYFVRKLRTLLWTFSLCFGVVMSMLWAQKWWQQGLGRALGPVKTRNILLATSNLGKPLTWGDWAPHKRHLTGNEG